MKQYFEIACAEAEKGMLAGEGGPFGAVIVKEEKVIASGHNLVLAKNDSTAHAEINAIRQAEQDLGTFDLSGCELYTTSYPCPMCLGAILWARISRVYYVNNLTDAATAGFEDNHFYEVMQDISKQTTIILEQIENKRCRELMKTWQKMENRQSY